jgi:hypothetical protein
MIRSTGAGIANAEMRRDLCSGLTASNGEFGSKSLRQDAGVCVLAGAGDEMYVDRESLRLHRSHEIYRIERRRGVERDVTTLTVSRSAQPAQPTDGNPHSEPLATFRGPSAFRLRLQVCCPSPSPSFSRDYCRLLSVVHCVRLL